MSYERKTVSFFESHYLKDGTEWIWLLNMRVDGFFYIKNCTRAISIDVFAGLCISEKCVLNGWNNDTIYKLQRFGAEIGLIWKNQQSIWLKKKLTAAKWTYSVPEDVKKIETRENGVHQVAVNIPGPVESSVTLNDKMNLQKNGKVTIDNKIEIESTNSSSKIINFNKITHIKINKTEKCLDVSVKMV